MASAAPQASSVLRACLLGLAEENDVGCPQGFELDTQSEFCVGEHPLPTLAWTREASQPGLADGRACACRPPALPTPPDRDECSGGPSPCSHACHNVPGRFSCSCPTGFALAEDDRNCRGEGGPRGRLLLDLARCVQDPGLFLGTLMPARGFQCPIPTSLSTPDGKDSSPRGDGDPQRHARGHHVLAALVPAEPGHSLRSHPCTQGSLVVTWG